MSSRSSSADRKDDALADFVGSFPPNSMDIDGSDGQRKRSAIIGDEQDEVVQVIPVFLSPELSENLQLIQFPLQQQGTPTPSQPLEVRYRPRHCMMEVDFSAPEHIQVEGNYHLGQRTYASHTIPISTHLALGKLLPLEGNASDGMQKLVGLHLVPLAGMSQLRPDFKHVDQEYELEIEEEAELQSQDMQEEGKPVTFQKKESERAELARKSSFAYRKTSEDSELWQILQIFDETSDEAAHLLNLVNCSDPHRNLIQHSSTLKARNGQTLSSETLNERYVNSLNYLPTSKQSVDVVVKIEESVEEDDNKKLVEKLVQVMHLGSPIPFSVIRAQFPDTNLVSDNTLLLALGSCSVIVRGNFCLSSRLMAMPPSVAQARTFLLFLFQSMGVVHRKRLEHVFTSEKNGRINGSEMDASASDEVTSAVLEMLLDQIGKKTEAGWVLKVEEDLGFGVTYPEAMLAHIRHWAVLMNLFQRMLQRYRETIEL